jgi:hypothetical protein
MQLAPWGGRHSKTAKLSREQAADIIQHCTQPKQDAEYAAKYGVSAETIRMIRTGKAWAWLRDEVKGRGGNP